MILMFENINKDYWYYKGLNYGRSKEEYRKHGIKQLIDELEDLSLDDLKEISSMLNISKIDKEDKDTYIQALTGEKSIGLQLLMLSLFLRTYEKSSNDYINKHKSSNGKSNSSYVILLSLFLDNNHDHLLDILINHNWEAAGTGTILESKENLPEGAKKNFENDAKSFAKKFSTKNPYFGKKKAKYIGKSEAIFLFDRQIGDKVIQTIGKPQRLKPSIYVLIKISSRGLEIREKRSHNYTINRIKVITEKLFNIELENTSERPAKGDISKFIKRFTEKPVKDNRLSIISLKLRHSELPEAVPIEIDNFQAGNDIVGAIKELVLDNKKLAELIEITDIDRFNVSYSSDGRLGNRRRITIKEKEDGSIILEVDSKSMNDEERGGFYKAFQEQFGLSLNVPLDPTNLTSNRKHIIDYILSEGKIDTSRKFLVETANKLRTIGLISTVEKYKLKCSNCKKISFYEKEDSKCRDCGSRTYMVKNAPQLSVKINDTGIQKYIKKFIQKNETAKVIAKRKVAVGYTTFPFIELEYKLRPLLVLINTQKLSNNTLKSLETIGVPILLINVTKSASSNINQEVFEQFELSHIIENEEEDSKELTKKYDRLLNYAVDRINRAASESSKNMESKLKDSKSYPWSEFQTDVLNIVKQIFPTAHKGATKYVPEGFAGTTYLSKGKGKRGTIEWDCKLSQGSKPYNLTQSEIDQAWRYIRSSLKSPELRSFSGKLNSYVIVSNNIEDSNFGNFAASLTRKRLWKGRKSVVLFTAEGVIELQKQYAMNQLAIIKRPNIFYDSFFNKLRKIDKKAGYVKLDEKYIKELFDHVIKEPKEFNEPDWAKVEAHMKKDED